MTLEVPPNLAYYISLVLCHHLVDHVINQKVIHAVLIKHQNLEHQPNFEFFVAVCTFVEELEFAFMGFKIVLNQSDLSANQKSNLKPNLFIS